MCHVLYVGPFQSCTESIRAAQNIFEQIRSNFDEVAQGLDGDTMLLLT